MNPVVVEKTSERTRRLLVSLVIALCSLALLAWYSRGDTTKRDFDVFYAGARALRDGLNPYDVIGPGRAFEWWTPLYYPLPALVLLAPLTWLSSSTAAYVFVGVSAFALSYGVAQQRRPWMFVMFASQAYISCVALGQWSILLLAAVFLPLLKGIVVAKPNVGVAVAAATDGRKAAVGLLAGSLILIGVSLLLRPNWIASWRAMVAHAPQTRAPVQYVGGMVVLAALLRWRRPEARYLAALALVPQSPGPYTDLLLFAIPRAKWEALILALLSYCTLPISDRMPALSTLQERMIRYGGISVLALMLPCLVMVLRRPNVGTIPQWLERLVEHLPFWLRGTAIQADDAPAVFGPSESPTAYS